MLHRLGAIIRMSGFALSLMTLAGAGVANAASTCGIESGRVSTPECPRKRSIERSVPSNSDNYNTGAAIGASIGGIIDAIGRSAARQREAEEEEFREQLRQGELKDKRANQSAEALKKKYSNAEEANPWGKKRIRKEPDKMPRAPYVDSKCVSIQPYDGAARDGWTTASIMNKCNMPIAVRYCFYAPGTEREKKCADPQDKQGRYYGLSATIQAGKKGIVVPGPQKARWGVHFLACDMRSAPGKKVYCLAPAG